MRPILSTLLLLLGATLLSCGGGGGGGAISPFYIVRTSPTGGATSVSVYARLYVHFTLPVDAETVDATSLGVVRTAGDQPVEGVTEIHDDGSGSVLVWTPLGGMTPGAVHRCRVADTLRSVEGHAVGEPSAFAFWTEGEDALGIPDFDDLRELDDRLVIGRRKHTATLLLDGRVLVAGGYTRSTSITDRAEIYDAETFTESGDRMEHERAAHTATRLVDGRVLLAGGWYERALGDLATTAHAEIYDPETDLFTAVGPMNEDRVDHAALLLPDGRVFITGGSSFDGVFLWDHDTAEIFDPATGTFTVHAESMVHTRATHAMVDTSRGRYVLAGGSDQDGRPSYFHWATGAFEALEPPVGEGQRWGPAGAAFESGDVCIAGGDEYGTVLHIGALDGRVRNTSSGLTVPRWYATATRIGPGRILVAGGYDFNRGLFVHHSADIVIEGGLSGSSTYATGVSFRTGMVDHTATRLDDGSVLFCGGLNVNGGEPELDRAYVLTP